MTSCIRLPSPRQARRRRCPPTDQPGAADAPRPHERIDPPVTTMRLPSSMSSVGIHDTTTWPGSTATVPPANRSLLRGAVSMAVVVVAAAVLAACSGVPGSSAAFDVTQIADQVAPVGAGRADPGPATGPDRPRLHRGDVPARPGHRIRVELRRRPAVPHPGRTGQLAAQRHAGGGAGRRLPHRRRG